MSVLKSRKPTIRKSAVTPRVAVEIIASHRIQKVGSISSPVIDTHIIVCDCILTYIVAYQE